MTPSASAVALDLFVVFLVAVVAPLGVMLCQSRRASKRAVAFGLLAAAFAYIAVFEHARSRERFVARTSAVMEMRRARGLGQKATEKATVDVGSEEEEAAEQAGEEAAADPASGPEDAAADPAGGEAGAERAVGDEHGSVGSSVLMMRRQLLQHAQLTISSSQYWMKMEKQDLRGHLVSVRYRPRMRLLQTIVMVTPQTR